MKSATLHLVFAFGSNLSAEQMRRRCPGAQLAGPATLRGYTLDFAGSSGTWGGSVATIRRRRGATVSGAVYVLNDRDFAALDGCEGYPTCYVRTPVAVKVEGLPRKVRAWAYIHRSPNRGLPALRYLERIACGYEELGLPLAELVPHFKAALADAEISRARTPLAKRKVHTLTTAEIRSLGKDLTRRAQRKRGRGWQPAQLEFSSPGRARRRR